MSTDGELWHIVEAKRDDGTPTMFRIRELPPQKHLTRIFVVELPYPTTEMSRLPSASAYRRVAELEERWLRPACQTLGWEFVGSKTEDGSFFLYMYGGSDPQQLVERLSPFDVALGFYDDVDPDWQEYATLKELLDQAKAIPKKLDQKSVAAAKKPIGKKPARKKAAAKKAAPKKSAVKRPAVKKPSAKKQSKPKKATPKKR